ncbi:MAG: PilZ domain-containing protein [Nitrospiraceae bacterium]|nr:MAG: PilZ domain-containing protein [Nitrospiraceae bacterium]
MRKRARTKITSHLPINFQYKNAVYTGTILDFSKKDLFIKMETPCTFTTERKRFEVRIPLKDRVLLATARIKRIHINGRDVNGIGVELEYPIQESDLINI